MDVIFSSVTKAIDQKERSERTRSDLSAISFRNGVTTTAITGLPMYTQTRNSLRHWAVIHSGTGLITHGRMPGSGGGTVIGIAGSVQGTVKHARCSTADCTKTSTKPNGAVAETKVCNSSFFCANFCKKYRTRKNIDKKPEVGLSNKQKRQNFRKFRI